MGIHRRHPPRRGAAMLLVMGVIAMAAVLGYAMLAGASLQRQISANSGDSTESYGLAESGVNLAIYYLLNPDKAPGYPTTTALATTYERAGNFWGGTSDAFVSFNEALPGAVKITVVRPDASKRWLYRITSVGRASDSALERKVVCHVWVNADYVIKHAATFTSDVLLPGAARIGTAGGNNGNVYGSGAVQIRSGGIVNGIGYRGKSLASAASPTGGFQWVPLVPRIVPATLAEIRDYRSYEYPAAVNNQARVLTGVTEIGEACTVKRLDPETGNAAGVYYVAGNLTLRKNAVINGTLIVDGRLTIEGTGITAKPAAGFPALLVTGNIFFSSTVVSDLRVDGLCWIGGMLESVAQVPTFTVDGAVLVAGATPAFAGNTLAKLIVTYNDSKLQVRDLSEIARTPRSVKTLSWQHSN